MAPKKERYFSSNIIFSLKNIILAAARVNFFFVIRWAGNKPIISFSLTNWVTNKCPHVHPLPLAESKDATFQAHLRCSRKLSAPVRKKGNSRRSVMPAGKSMAISGRLRSNFSRWFTRWSWLMRQCYWCHNLKCRCLCVREFPSQRLVSLHHVSAELWDLSESELFFETCLDKLTDGLWMIDFTSGFK